LIVSGKSRKSAARTSATTFYRLMSKKFCGLPKRNFLKTGASFAGTADRFGMLFR
jgi:hypothetical protein